MIRAADLSSFSRRGSLPAGSCLRSTGLLDLTNDNGRYICYRFSDESVARDGHRILAGAWQLSSFLSNPVFLWGHDNSEPPIGRVIEIGEANGILSGTVEYLERDINPLADMVFRMVKAGFLNATSVAWNPLKWRYSNDRSRPGGIDFEQVDLLEISQVPVPSLPTALVTARSVGIDTVPMQKWAEKALDRKDFPMSRNDLAAVRRAAGAPAAYPATSSASGALVRFPSLGSQLQAIVEACADPTKIDSRLVRAPAGMNEGDPSAGGFLVQANFVNDLIGGLYDESEIASRCDRRPAAPPLAEVNIPAIDETSRADGSRWGGVQSYWASEADQVSASLPRFRNIEFSAKKLICLVRGTASLQADAPLLEAHIRRGFAAEASFKVDLAVLAGTGAGQLLGILNAPATIVVPKEIGQASKTITAANISSMWSRLPAPCRKRSVWLVNEDVESQLEQMVNVVGTGGVSPPAAQALYMPGGTVGGNSYPMLKGRPVIAVEQCSMLGAKGDIVLADLSQYIIIDGGMTPALSAHVRFLNDELVWRFVLRIDGAPAYVSPITPYNGSGSRSPFVTLESR